MLTILLKILSILGIILLVAFAILLLLIILALFFPITYKLYGDKKAEQLTCYAKVNWLFGLLRLHYAYPQPGTVKIKLLFFTLFDSGRTQQGKSAQEQEKPKEQEKPREQGVSQEQPSQGQQMSQGQESSQEQEKPLEQEPPQEQEKTGENAGSEKDESKQSFFFRKIEKIKYTFQKIYGKIRHVCRHLVYYKELLNAPDTRELLKHGGRRWCKIWKRLRPRKLRADILFGTGEPDTTGYMLGVYCILSPGLGNHVNITPDFNQPVLEGEVYAAGHCMLFTLLWNAGMLLLDKRLRKLIHKLKNPVIT